MEVRKGSGDMKQAIPGKRIMIRRWGGRGSGWIKATERIGMARLVGWKKGKKGDINPHFLGVRYCLPASGCGIPNSLSPVAWCIDTLSLDCQKHRCKKKRFRKK